MTGRWWVAGLLMLGMPACSDGTAPGGTLVLEADFNQAAGWVADFVDVPASQEPDVQFEAGTRPLPDNLGAGQQGLYHAGTNISDDLFMFFRKQVSGLEPGTTYRATFERTFASTAAPPLGDTRNPVPGCASNRAWGGWPSPWAAGR